MVNLGRTPLVERLLSMRTSTKVLLFFIFASLIPLYALVSLTDRANSSILYTPEDIAAACAFLISDEAGYITGQILGVNGGRNT